MKNLNKELYNILGESYIKSNKMDGIIRKGAPNKYQKVLYDIHNRPIKAIGENKKLKEAMDVIADNFNNQ